MSSEKKKNVYNKTIYIHLYYCIILKNNIAYALRGVNTTGPQGGYIRGW